MSTTTVRIRCRHCRRVTEHLRSARAGWLVCDMCGTWRAVPREAACPAPIPTRIPGAGTFAELSQPPQED